MKMAETENYGGNTDRGWNDPPVTAYTSAISAKPKNKLNQRIAFPPDAATASSRSKKPAQAQLPPVGPFCANSDEKNVETKTDDAKLIERSDIEVVNSRLKSMLTRHEDKFNKKTHDEIIKRLQILEQTWRDGKLNDVIQQRIMQLSRALEDANFDEANRIHLTLAVDYAGLVSPWLVGVKHLIQQAKNADSSSTAS